MDKILNQAIDEELQNLRVLGKNEDDEWGEWEPVTVESENKKNEDDEWGEWEPVNIPSYTTLDADTNKVYSVPATMDETDTRFAIHTQAEKINKDNFLGKVLLYGGQLALDYAKGKAKEAIGEAKQAPKSAAAGALDIAGSIARGETDLLFDYFRKKERAEKGKNEASSSMPRLGLAELFLPNDVVEAGRAAGEATYIVDEMRETRESRVSREMAENPVSLMYGGEFDRPVSDEEFDAAQKNAQELNQKVVALYEKWRQHNVETINKISLGLMPEEMRGKKDFQNVMYGIGNSATSIAGTAAITLATKNPYIAAGMISKAYFDSSKSEAFQEAIAQGEDFDTADLHSDILGAFDGALEGIGNFIMMGIAKVGTAPASKAMKNAFVGSVEKILKNKAVEAPVKTAVKNVARQSSVFKAAVKGFLTEGPFEETVQNVFGDEYRNAIGWQDKTQADIWADGMFSGFVGGITGAGFGAGGTMLYNHRMRNWNRQIKDQVKAYNPDIDDQTAQMTADLLQETFLQESAPVLDELGQLLNKEKDPDTMPEGIDARSISEVSRQVMKERFGVTDEQIDQWAKAVSPMIDARNQYNEVYQHFYEQLTTAGRPNAEADADAHFLASRAVTLAINEGKSTADILERWQLRIEDGEQGSAVYLAEREETPNLEQAMYKSPMTDFGDFYDDISKNENTKDRYFAEDINGIGLDIPRNTIIHDKNKHNLSKEEWQGIIEAIKNNQIKEARIGDYSRMRGIPVKMVVDVNGLEYGVAFDHMKSGRNLVGSAFVLEDKGWINEKQKKSSQMEAYKPLPNSSSLGNSMSEIISALDNNVNDTLYQLPQEAYGADGKADINTPEFKRWSGSVDVVVPEKARNYDFQTGKPVVVEGFHGSGIKNIAVFDNKDVKTKSEGRGFYFTDRKDSAATYGNELYNVYLSMKNPFVVDYKNKFYYQLVVADGIAFSGKNTGYSATSVPSITEVVQYAQANGYDGVVVKNVVDSGNLAKLGYTANMERRKELLKLPEDELYLLFKEVDGADLPIEQARSGFGLNKRDFKEYMAGIIEQAEREKNISDFAQTDYIVFEPNQIKSVYNRGTFDPASDNIYYQTGEPLTERENGYKIADDNETVEAVVIPENAVPDFKTKRELVNFIKEILGSERNITIKSTGDEVLVSNAGINRATAKSRSSEYNQVFGAVKSLLENAKYSGFEEADARHPNVKGQDVYHSAMMIGGVPYSVMFKIDIPVESGSHNYAGHKISDIEIAPSEADGRFTSPMQSDDATYKISLAVLRGKVNPARYDNSSNIFYQIQEYDDLKSTNTVGDVKKLLKGLIPNEEIRLMYDKNKHYWFAIDADNYIHQDMITKAFEQGLYPEFDSSYEAQQYFDENYNADDEYLIRFKAESYSSKDDLQNILQDKLNQDEYKVAYSLGDENEKGYVVFARSLYDLSETPLKTIGKDAEVWSRNPYMMTEIKKLSVEDLAQEGIFYQTADGELNLEVTPAQRQGEDNPRGSFTRYRDTGEAIIRIFQTADASTVVHELGHFFLDDMRRFADNPETAAQLQAIYRYVGSTDGNLTREQHEYFADSFEAYLLEGRSPNALLKKVFRRFKSWLRNLYNEVKRLEYVKLDDEIRKTFDDMLGGRKIDFAMQQSGVAMREKLAKGNISQQTINKAMKLLSDGKMSKADMDDLIARLKNNELDAAGFASELKAIEASDNINNEEKSAYDYLKYRQALSNGNLYKRDVRAKIERLVNWTKPRSQGGKLVGRFPDIKLNREFDHIREILALGKEEALQKISENQRMIENLDKHVEGAEGNREALVWENKLLSIAANRASMNNLLDVYDAISDSYNSGRLSAAITGELKRARRKRLIDEAKNVLTGNGRINWREERSGLKAFANRLGVSQMSWNGLMDILSMNDKSSTTGKSLLNQNMDVFEAEQNMQKGIADDGENVSLRLEKALKGNNNRAISVNRYVNNELQKKYTIEWSGGKRVFTKDQLLDIYMKAKDPETREMMLKDDILQFNEDFLQEVDNNLTADDVAVTEALFEFYDENYQKINAFYEQHFGISLGKRQFYSPRSIERGGVNVETGDMISYAGFSGVKQRTAKAGALKIKGAFNALNSYIVNSNHYMAFSDKLQDINAVFGDVEIKTIVKNLFGQQMQKRIDYEVSNFANNGRMRTEGWGRFFNRLRYNYAVSVLALKPALAIKQFTSFPAYWENMSAKDFVAGLADFAMHYREAVETLGNTTLMKTRDANIIRDLEELSKTDLIKNKAKNINLRELMMANIRMGDRFTIYSGGWALYKSELKKNLKAGMNEAAAKAKALDTFERVTDETQQSGRMSQQSYWQSNAFLRAFTMFQSSQNQYLRKEINALRGVFTGRMSKKQAAKTIFIYHFLLPMFFQFVADGFRWDDEAQLRAGFFGSFNGIFILNQALEGLWDATVGGKGTYGLGLRVRDAIPFEGSIEDIIKEVMKMAEDDLDMEDWIDILQKFGKSSGEVLGVPVKYPLDIINNFGDYAKAGEPGKEIMLWLGWSPYALRDFEDE